MQAAAKAWSSGRYFSSPTRLTIGAKRNALIQAARGDVIASYDDDDLYHPTHLSHVVEWLRDHDFAKLSVFRMRREADGSEWRWDTTRCGEDCYVVTGDGTTLGPVPADKDQAGCDSALWGYGFSFCFRRAVAIAEPFADMSLGEDYEFAQRIRKRFRCLQVADGEHLIEHTLHPRSSSAVFPQRRISGTAGGNLPVMTQLPEGQPITITAGVRYCGVALLKNAHTATDLKAKIAARGIKLDELSDDTGAGLPSAPDGYRYVRFAGTATAEGTLPWELPRPWQYIDQTRFMHIGAAKRTRRIATSSWCAPLSAPPNRGMLPACLSPATQRPSSGGGRDELRLGDLRQGRAGGRALRSEALRRPRTAASVHGRLGDGHRAAAARGAMGLLW